MLVPRVPLALVLTGLVLTGCGGGEESSSDPVQAVESSARDKVRAAQTIDVATFPKPGTGESLETFAAQFETNGPQAIAANSVFTPGKKQRLAFGLLDDRLRFTYGQTVVYLQRRSGGPVLGPFAAPADVLVTKPRYRSRQAASETDPFAAIYTATIPLKRPGTWHALAVSDQAGGRRIAAPMAFQVISRQSDPIPDVGEKAPPVETDTLASLKGNAELLDTRVPQAPELSQHSFADVAGEKPVALLFATPQLCQSRVCGPIVDEMLQLKAKYGDRMTFIHQEVYVENDPGKGLRAPLQRYRLPSEPWLFTVRRDGTIAARLEGSVGLKAFEDAIKAAL
jgi:hypothetical protein